MKLFGTDGIRFLVDRGQEVPNDDIIYSPELILKLALASAVGLQRGKYIIVQDTRKSSHHISMIFSGAFASAGSEILTGGILPTPAASILVKKLGLDGAFSISASHNPPQYNGIKFFLKDGFKADRKTEEIIEEKFSDIEKNGNYSSQIANKISRIHNLSEIAFSTYKSSILNLFPKNFLRGLRIVLDCSNGATYKIAPEIFYELGANIKAIGVNPDGENINQGIGSENPDTALKQEGDFKIIFDGDGDRVLIADSTELYDGDQIISVLAKFMKDEGTLRWGIVGTILSNFALEIFCKELGLNFIRVDVGDRNIAYKMKELSANLGGEESGHIILMDIVPTGDGIITALKTLYYILKSGKELKALAIKKFYQAKAKVSISKRLDLNSDIFLQVHKISKEIERENGRAVIRYSGTEPVLRIMVEHQDKEKAEKYKNILEEEIRKIFLSH